MAKAAMTDVVLQCPKTPEHHSLRPSASGALSLFTGRGTAGSFMPNP